MTTYALLSPPRTERLLVTAAVPLKNWSGNLGEINGLDMSSLEMVTGLLIRQAVHIYASTFDTHLCV